tara:strand:+ start:230 stop:595 length:366 start_codon:yes stop_codon:yes gene_type:complete
MAHYAFLDSNNIVTEVITGVEEDTDGQDWEVKYGQMRGQTCKRTSYNTVSGQHILGGTPFRGRYAGVGYSYNETLDAFISPKPFESWVLNKSTYSYDPPSACPGDLIDYKWNEATTSWVLK